jgi:hypothetical protein
MSPIVKTKRQANFKDFKRFGAFKRFVEKKQHCIQLAKFYAEKILPSVNYLFIYFQAVTCFALK